MGKEMPIALHTESTIGKRANYNEILRLLQEDLFLMVS